MRQPLLLGSLPATPTEGGAVGSHRGPFFFPLPLWWLWFGLGAECLPLHAGQLGLSGSGPN